MEWTDDYGYTYSWRVRGQPGAGLLRSIYQRNQIKEPTWCRDVVYRLSRRRFVSYQEIDEILIPKFAEKHNYPEQLIRQHWFNRDDIPQWFGLPRERIPTAWGPFSWVAEWQDRLGRSRYVARCRVCAAEIPESWRTRRLRVCGFAICHDAAQWHKDHGFRDLSGIDARFEITGLYGLEILTRYLKWLADQKRPKRCARNYSTRSKNSQTAG